MNAQEIESRVTRVIAEQLCFPGEKDKVKLQSTFRSDLGADSLDEIEIVIALEDEFEIEISDEDAEKINTVKGAVEYLTERLKSVAAPTFLTKVEQQ